MQCGMNLQREGDSWQVLPRDFPTNNGGMCRKGWTSATLLEHPERLTKPLLREKNTDDFRAVSWEEALDFVANRWRQIQSAKGRDRVGIFGSGALTNEKAYALGKFARVALATSNIDYNGRFCMASGAAGGNRAFGVDRGLPFPMSDIARADAVFLFGSNVAETMPPIVQWFEKLRENGGKLLVSDPRATPTVQNADFHLQVTPGSDIALALGMLFVAIEEDLLDREFIQSRTEGFERVAKTAMNYWPARVEKLTGIDEIQLRETTRLLARGNSMFLTARGTEQHANGSDTVSAIINLALALGKVGKPLNGYGCLTGQGNGQGGREHGQKADQLPGYRKIDDPADRAYIAKIWGIEERDLPQKGRSGYEMLDAIGAPDGICSLWVVGSNLAVSTPRAGHIQNRLRELELLVVSDFFLSETAQLAHVVFPTAQWAEEEGTMTNLEGRVIKRNRAKTPPEGVLTDAQTMHELAKRLGCGEKFPTQPRDLFDELRLATQGATADYSGVSYEKVERENGVFWPCNAEKSPDGTPRMFLEKFAHPSGRARFFDVDFWGLPEEPDADFPFYFTTGRVMGHYQSGTQTRRVTELQAATPEVFVEIHPDAARELNIENGARVRVSSRRGEAIGAAKITEEIRADTLFMPFHWGGKSCANLLTIPALDPTSKMPEFKVCAAKIERLETIETVAETII